MHYLSSEFLKFSEYGMDLKIVTSKKRMRTILPGIITLTQVSIKTTTSTERRKVAPSQSPDVSMHMTDFESTKCQNELKLIQPIIFAPTDGQTSATQTTTPKK